VAKKSSKKKPEKEDKPKEKEGKKRQNHRQQTTDVRPRFLIPGIRLRTMRTKFAVCHKRTLTFFANLKRHKSRIVKKWKSGKVEKLSADWRTAFPTFHFFTFSLIIKNF
jgi:hypothetical protein